MSLLSTIAQIVNDVTLSLEFQSTVTFQRYLSEAGDGAKVYATAVTLRAIVEEKQSQVRTQTGSLAMSRAKVTFLDLPALAAVTNNLGVSVNDLITLQNGAIGPILATSGFMDTTTGQVVPMEVWLG